MTNKRTKKQIKEDAKAMRELNEWSRKVFGYTKNGWLYVDNNPVSFIGMMMKMTSFYPDCS